MIKKHQVKIPKEVANNLLSVHVESNGVLVLYWDCDSSAETMTKEDKK